MGDAGSGRRVGGPVIRVRDLVHKYGDFTAVDKISFDVREGEIFSFLGPNGAGKTTTINVLITLLKPTSGSCSIDGIDPQEDPDEVRERIGIVFQNEVLDADLTVFETLEFHGRLYSMPKAKRRERIDELLDVVELSQKRDSLVKELSGGMKRRLEIARGLMTRPKVLFLDEPTLGLDPQTRLHIWDYVKQINRDGVTIFLTTHYMDEADQLSDRIKIIDKGRIIAAGTPDELKDSMGKDIMVLKPSDEADATRAKGLLEGDPVVRSSRLIDSALELTLNQPGSALVAKFIRRLAEADPPIEVVDMHVKRPTLDKVFVSYTGRDLRDQKADGFFMARRRARRGH